MRGFGRKKAARALALAALFAFIAFLSGCLPGGGAGSGNATPANPSAGEESAPAGQKLSVAVYYVKMTDRDAYLVREVHQVPYTREVARAALEELISGSPVTPGAVRVLPPAARIRGITVRDGFATVDFSREVLRANVGASGEALGIQSIVNTLTELPGIQKVSFLVEGRLDEEARNWWGHVGLYTQPFTRDVTRVYEPAVWVTQPQPGQKVGTPLAVRGSARVFEGAVSARLVDGSGKVLVEGSGTAAQGAPGRGDFAVSLAFSAAAPGSGRLEVFWRSPKDGKEMDKVVVPVSW